MKWLNENLADSNLAMNFNDEEKHDCRSKLVPHACKKGIYVNTMLRKMTFSDTEYRW